MARSNGTQNYSLEELMDMLGVLEEILPIGNEEWEAVRQQHFERWPVPGRDAAAIRRKWVNLHRKKVPTGDPNIAPEVAKAKEVKYIIGARASIGDGEEDYDLEDGFNDSGVVGATLDTGRPASHLAAQRARAAAAAAAMVSPVALLRLGRGGRGAAAAG